MNEIFYREEKVAEAAEELLEKNQFASASDKENYKLLCEEYKTLLRQMMRVVKLSDLMQMELKSISKKLEVASQIDALTGLYNRRYFNEIYLKEWKSAIRSNYVLSLVMIDIDFFKKYNDTYGHLQGDECLKAVAARIQDTVKRPRDMVARFGGEEFMILLPETGADGAAFIARKVLENINELEMEHLGSTLNKKVTVSIGVAVAQPNVGDSPDILLNQTDHALYTAKRDGKNCFRIHESMQDIV